MGREAKNVVTCPWFAKKEAGGWEMVIMFQALYLLTDLSLQYYHFIDVELKAQKNQNYLSQGHPVKMW